MLVLLYEFFGSLSKQCKLGSNQAKIWSISHEDIVCFYDKIGIKAVLNIS
jgi:hypothetical protein